MADSTRRDTVLAQLSEGVAELTSSDAWRRWLDVQSRFHRYSFGYVASWAGGGDEAIAGIKASGQRIQQAANRILDGVEVVEEVAA